LFAVARRHAARVARQNAVHARRRCNTLSSRATSADVVWSALVPRRRSFTRIESPPSPADTPKRYAVCVTSRCCRRRVATSPGDWSAPGYMPFFRGQPWLVASGRVLKRCSPEGDANRPVYRQLPVATRERFVRAYGRSMSLRTPCSVCRTRERLQVLPATTWMPSVYAIWLGRVGVVFAQRCRCATSC